MTYGEWTYNKAALYLEEFKDLPEDFDQWDLRNESRRTVAHIAAYHGYHPHPPDSPIWGFSDYNGETVARWVAQHSRLPEDFIQWNLSVNKSNYPIVLWAAAMGGLPASFTQWDMPKGKDIRTAAEVAAMYITLPKDFHRWDIPCLEKKHTVLEEFLKRSLGKSKEEFLKVAEWFTDWDMVIDENGRTCRDVYERIKEGGL